MIDPSDRIVRINEVLAALIEQPEIPPSLPPGPKPTAEQEAERDARRAEARKRADEEQQAKFKKERDDVEAARKFNPNATRFYPDVTMKGKERREALRGYMDYLRMDPERLRLFKQQKAYASAEMVGQAQRARTAYDRSAASTASRIAGWEAAQNQKIIDRISKTSTGKEYLAAKAEAEKAQAAYDDLVASQETEPEIRARFKRERESLENELRQTVEPSTPGNEDFENEVRVRGSPPPRPPASASRSSSGTPAGNKPQQGQGQDQSQSQGNYEFYNRRSGQIERSNAPGVDRVFRDSSGKAYRIEGGSGRKIYI